jgi:hypothetical protein
VNSLNRIKWKNSTHTLDKINQEWREKIPSQTNEITKESKLLGGRLWSLREICRGLMKAV